MAFQPNQFWSYPLKKKKLIEIRWYRTIGNFLNKSNCLKSKAYKCIFWTVQIWKYCKSRFLKILSQIHQQYAWIIKFKVLIVNTQNESSPATTHPDFEICCCYNLIKSSFISPQSKSLTRFRKKNATHMVKALLSCLCNHSTGTSQSKIPSIITQYLHFAPSQKTSELKSLPSKESLCTRTRET